MLEVKKVNSLVKLGSFSIKLSKEAKGVHYILSISN
jgi:hypothetical protein